MIYASNPIESNILNRFHSKFVISYVSIETYGLVGGGGRVRVKIRRMNLIEILL